MPKSNNSQTTDQKIEDLAIMVGRGFAETKEDLGMLRKEVREGFASVERRLERVEAHTSGLERRVEKVEDRVFQLARKVGLKFN